MIAHEEATISLESVSIDYPSGSDHMISVVRDLDLAIYPGTITAVTGRSGSGKTSVLRVCLGDAEPSSGHVCWLGRALPDLSQAEQRALRSQNLGYLDQQARLVPYLTAMENALLPAAASRGGRRNREAAESYVRGLFEELGIGPRAHHYPRALSGGEQRRVAFARALVVHPSILILDEPTSELDRASADLVIDLIRSQRDNQAAVLVATHDPVLIEHADQAVPIETSTTATASSDGS